MSVLSRALSVQRAALGSVRLLSSSAAVRKAAPDFFYQPLFETAAKDETPYKKLTGDYVSVEEVKGRK